MATIIQKLGSWAIDMFGIFDINKGSLVFSGIEALAKNEGCEMIIEGCTPVIKCADKSERISMAKIKGCVNDNGYYQLATHIQDICNKLKTGS